MKAIIEHLGQDPILRPILSEKLSLGRASNDLFGDLIRSITGQQLSTKAAATIHGRFVASFAEGVTPAAVLRKNIDQLRAVGLSQQKSNYVQNVAQYFEKNPLTEAQWSQMTDEELIAQLTDIKGVGKWTVQMILMFSLQRPDVFPVDDLGIKNAMVELYGLEETGKALKQKMLEIAIRWSPYRTYASRFLWDWRDGKKSE